MGTSDFFMGMSNILRLLVPLASGLNFLISTPGFTMHEEVTIGISVSALAGLEINFFPLS